MDNRRASSTSIRQRLAALRDARPVVLPSLLLCDFGNLEREVRRLEEGGAAGLHLDVMDGHFVPNLTYGMPLVEALRRLTDLPLDVHLMISQPDRYLEAFREAGADLITVHVEAEGQPVELLERLHDLDVGAGIALNPPTPLAAIEDCLPHCDLVLVMSVMPGFGGQSFDARALDKLKELKNLVGPEVLLEIDGGVNDETIARASQAGADTFVVGSAIFNHDDYSSRLKTLTDLAATATVT